MVKHRFSLALAFTAAAFTTLPALAQSRSDDRDQDRDRQRQRDRDRERDQQSRPEVEPQLLRMQQVSDVRVEANGERLGALNEVVLDLQYGRARYAILEVADRADLSQRQLAVPWQALKFESSGQNENINRATLNMTMDRLKNAPPFDSAGLRTAGDERWGEIVYNFYGLEPYWEKPRQEQFRDKPLVLAGEAFEEYTVQSRDGQRLAGIEDVVIEARTGRIAMVIIDNIQDAPQKLVAVPWTTLRVQPGQNTIALEIGARQLREAPSFTSQTWQRMERRRWVNEVHAFFDADPGWVYGYADDREGRPQTRPPNQNRAAAAEHDPYYSRFFDRSTMETVQGRVERVETFKPDPNIGDFVRLRMRAQGDRDLEVHLAPSWFIDNQPARIKQGDEVTVAGSRVQIDNRQVIIATRVRLGEQFLVLRDRDGGPLWIAWRSADQDARYERMGVGRMGGDDKDDRD